MALRDRLPGAKPTEPAQAPGYDAAPDGELQGFPVPGKVKTCLQRGRKVMQRDAAKRRLCMRFTRGDSYGWVNEKGLLSFLPTITFANGGGKPDYRIRNQYNFIGPIVEDKVSAATQRVPGYEVGPSTSDPEDWSAAGLAEKVALYGYDKWRVRAATVDAVKTALGQGGDAFVLPYFDQNVGPYHQQEDGTYRGAGEIKLRVFNGNQVYWEAGSQFETSPWWALEVAVPLTDLYDTPGYVGGALRPDAATSDIPQENSADRDQMVLKTEYFERPCPRYPEGRRLIIANDKQVVDYRKIDPESEYPWEPYPLRDADDVVIDEPILHRLVYSHDPDADRDLGLTWQLIDPQRTIQDCWNKILEWKNRALMPQLLAQKGTITKPRTDEPGAVVEFTGTTPPQWEVVNPTAINTLREIADAMTAMMKDLAAYEDVHADPNLAAATAQQVIQQSMARWQSFLGDLAEFHSRLMRHLLLLVGRYYDDPRLLLIRGSRGWESIKDFRGAQLMDQVNVQVRPGSLEYLTKTQIFQRVQFYVLNGWVSKEQAMAAIENGSATKLIDGYEQDVARINRIIQRIIDGTVMQMPTRMETRTVKDPGTGQPQIDPVTGQPVQVQEQVPTWMPNEWDNLDVWQFELANWMKTPDFEERLAPDRQEVARLIWQGLDEKQREKAQRDADFQNQMAEGLGLKNAAKPQLPKAIPSQPSNGGNGQPPQSQQPAAA